MQTNCHCQKSHEPMSPRQFHVIRTCLDTKDVFTFSLRAQDGSPFFFKPGQFNMLYLPAIGEAPISISGDPQKPDELVHTIRMVGPVTNTLGALKEGDTVGVRGPFGTGWPIESCKGKDLLIVAGGLGLPPLRPIIYEVCARRTDFRQISLVYGARTPQDLLFPDELERWRQVGIEIITTVDKAEETDGWQGNVGLVTQYLHEVSVEPLQAIVMTCGPEIMMRFVALEAIKLGILEENIFLSMERNMRCAIGFCGHCQMGKYFVCKDGPVFCYTDLLNYLEIKEI